MNHRIFAGTAYAGAAVIPFFALFYYAPTFGIGWFLTVLLWAEHYVRRTYEVAFVHKYTRNEPWFMDFGTILYYWGFASWFSYDMLNLLKASDLDVSAAIMYGAVFLLGEFGNAYHHNMLSKLRKSQGDSKVSLPRGALFDYVDMPHYFGELVAWCALAALVRSSVCLWVFFAVSFGILGGRAHQRHVSYKRAFASSYPAHRKRLIPFIF